MKPNQIIIYCGLLLSISAFSVDILLPAFGAISTDLAADYSLVQMTVPTFLATMGIGQIFMGPISDRFGRRPILLGGLALVAGGTVLCLLAADAAQLLAGRAIQGVGASAAPIIARAVLRDLFHGRELAANMALATMVFAFGPIVAPLLGVAFMQFGTWRMVFAAILLFSLVLLAVGLLVLPETLRERRPDAMAPGRLWRDAVAVLRHPQSRYYALLLGPVLTLMMLILISIPKVYRDSFGIEGAPFAMLFAVHGLGIIVGQSFNRRLIHRHGPQFALRTGGLITAGSAALIAAANLAGLMNAYTLSAILALFATGFLTMVSNCVALALDPHGAIAGFASSLVESVARIISSIAAAVLGLLIGGTLEHFIVVFALSSFVVLGLILQGQRRISA
ncbi:MAG: Bcr/CflA family efflux MFS transporter [Nitratireductor sp.]|nr:Bcr/CflA family efflux MFS transporter [Nitratireductor sp.]